MSGVKKGVNDLKTIYPNIAKEFHPTKNGELLPEDIASKSHKMIWWLCPKGHEWEAMVSNRTGLGRGCPYCTGQKVIPGETDLDSVSSIIAKQWNYKKNGNLKPSDISYGSNKKVWWKCEQGHEWQASVKTRVYYKTKCPYCPNTKTVIVTKGVNDFASHYPELVKDWHPTKNGDITPEDISYASGKKVWWKCPNGHEYQMVIGNKAKGRGCPICSRRRRTSFPEQAFYYYLKQAYPDAINSYKEIFSRGMELDIYIPSIRTGIEYDGKAFHKGRVSTIRDARKYQICKENGIQLIRIEDITNISIVTKSDRRIQLLSESEADIQNAIIELLYRLRQHDRVDVNLSRDRLKILKYLESLDVSLETEYPEIAKEFDCERNEGLKANFFHPGSNERVWWTCSQCGHKWRAAISDRTGEDKNGCPKCAKVIGGRKRRASIVAQKGSLAETHPSIMTMWNYDKNKVFPTEVSSGSGIKAWWKCERGHEWESIISHVVGRNQGCPYCSNKKILKGFNDLASVNPRLATEWDYEKNKEMTPYNTGAGSGKKAWWICSKCKYEWQARITNRNKGVGCPNCDNQRKIGNKYAVRKR